MAVAHFFYSLQVTKRKARAGISTKFPNANLESREAEINEYIDEYCEYFLLYCYIKYGHNSK